MVQFADEKGLPLLGEAPVGHVGHDADETPGQPVRRVALEAWRLVGGHGYGRVDMRIDANGQPWILEVNANPDIAPDAGLARMARVAGIDYAALVRTVCQLALERSRDAVPAEERWALAQRLSGLGGAGVPALDLFAASEG